MSRQYQGFLFEDQIENLQLFSLQEHDASRLHYDFRIEFFGAALSFVLPKGPPLRPGDRRLAVRVNDHHFNSLFAEGVIPPPRYGAGTVITSDLGPIGMLGAFDRRSNQEAILEGLREGKLQFILCGKKLRGKFSLIRKEEWGENQWLLLKEWDEHAHDVDVPLLNRSVLSGRTNEDLKRMAGESPD